MNINSKAITTLIEKLPFKQKVHPNRIYFKPSDVPAEELPDMNISDNAVVAPFAERLIHPDLFGLRPAVNGTKQLADNTYKLIEGMKDKNIRERFSKFYPMILDNSKDIHKDTHRMTSLIKSIELIDNPEIKTEILNKIDFLSKNGKKEFKKFYPHLMSFMEQYADAVNTINGKYLCIDNGARKFYKWMDKKNIWLVDIIDGTKKSETNYRNNLLSSKKRHKKYPEYLKNFDEYTKKGYAETFNNSLKQDAMKNFFDVYFDTRPEAVKKVYGEYLKTVSPDMAKECQEIQKEYNTYVITSNHDTTLEDLKYLKEELRLWKEAGKDEAVMPKTIYINTTDEYMLKTQASGFADMHKDTVYVRELLQDAGKTENNGSTLRHEIQHLHDKKAHTPKNSFDEAKDNIKWRYLKFRYGKKWDKELENGGLKSKEHRKYALTDEVELRSVTAETNMAKLSPEYKTQMEKDFKMQPWIFNIGDNEIAEQSKRSLDKVSEISK